YRTEHRRIEGVVITLVDITDLKQATRRLEARERQQAVIARLGLRGLREQDLQNFLEQTVREVQQTLSADCCEILELMPDRSRLLVRAAVGWNDPGDAGRRYVDAGPNDYAGFTLLCGEPLIVDDVAGERRFVVPTLAAGRPIASVISCEIRHAEATYGVLAAHAQKPHGFTREDADFLQAVAGVIASAVATHQTRQRLAVQGSVAEALAQSATGEEGLTKVLERLSMELGGCIGEFWGPSPDQALTCQLLSVRPPFTKEEIRATFSGGRFLPGEGLVGRIFAQASPTWFADLTDPKQFGRVDAGRALELVSGFGLPILCGAEVRGVVALFFQSHLFPDPMFARSLEMLGRMIGDFLLRVEMESRARRVAAIAESSHDAIISYDFDGIITEWLGGAERLYGYPASEMIGTSLARLVQPEQRGELSEIAAQIARGVVVEPLETLRLHRNGHPIEVSVRSSPLRDPRGNVVGISSTDRDISQQQETQRKLIEADQQKDEFLAMLSHELRNPLAAIHSATDLLKAHGGSAPEVQRTHAILERQTRHMAKLLDGLLDVSRIVRGQISIDTEVVDLTAICRELADDFTHPVARRQLEFRADVPANPVWVRGDRVRLAQIIDNLLSNSVRYTPEGGTIELLLRRDGDTAVLSVSDDGIGIEADLLPHIFGIFRQAQQTLDRTLGGLGLGLPLVKSLVELHDGSIEASSEGAGRGACFTVLLPLAVGPSSASHGVEPQAAVTHDIVLIEDNYDSADALRTLLEMSGHRVTLAGDGEQGIALVGEQQPDVVLCDIGLPNGVTGYDVAQRLRADPRTRDILLVAITGYGRPEDKRRCLEAGFDNHITKPLSLDAIEALLADVARSSPAAAE
ncbi:MAG: ATP-binding protein, partial [Pseudomonadales bacterium]